MLATNRTRRVWIKAAIVVGVAIAAICCAMLINPAAALTGGNTFETSITSASKLYANTSSGSSDWKAVDSEPVANDASLKLRIAFSIGNGAASNGSTLQYRLPNAVKLSSDRTVKGTIYSNNTVTDPDSTDAKKIGTYTVENGVLTTSFDSVNDSAMDSGSSSSSSSDSESTGKKTVDGYLDINLDFSELSLDKNGAATIQLNDTVKLKVASVTADEGTAASSNSSSAKSAKSAATTSSSASSASSASAKSSKKTVKSSATANFVQDSSATASNSASTSASKAKRFSAKRALSASASTGTDFTQYLTKKTGVQKFVNGKWTNVTEVTEGDTVRVNLAYTLPANTIDSTTEAGRTIYYQLPTGITPDEASSGRVTNANGKEVGSYTVGTDGKVTIVFDQSAVESASGAIEGTLSFEGTVSKLSGDDNGTYDFGGDSATITIKKKTTTETTDLKIEKSAPTVSDDKTTASYTVKLSSEKGTGGESVYFSDTMTGTNASPDFNDGSVTVYKVDASGNKTAVTDFTKSYQQGNESNKYRLDATLPALAAGESYEITYNVNINANATASNVNVSNTADGRTDHTDRVWDTKSFGWGTTVTKSGWYSSDSNTIHWDIRVNPNGSSIVGQKVTDNLPDGLKLTGSYSVKGDDGTMLVNANGSNGAAGDSSIDFTFPSTMDTGTALTDTQKQQAYTISFDTTAPAGNGTVTNSATGTDTSGKTSTDQTGVDVTHRTYDVSKSYNSDETSTYNGKDRRVKWTSTITLPDTNLVNFEYTDTIENATDGNGTDLGTDSHYALAGELENYLSKDQHLAINLSDGSQYVYRGYKASKDHVIKNGIESETDDVDIKVTYYDADGDEITPNDANHSKHIKSFKVSVTVANGVEVVAKNMQISGYQTYLSTSTGTGGDTWTAKNKGEINGKTSEATHAYPVPKTFDKSVRVKDGNAPDAFPSGSANITLDSLKNQLEYRLLLYTNASTGSTIQVTDTLPAGMEIVDGSVYARFYVNSYDEHTTNYVGTTFVDGANSTSGANPTYTATKNSDGTTTVVFTIGSYTYNSAYPQIALHYKTTVGNDGYWNNLSNLNKTYENTASWNGNTDSNKTTVTREIKNVEKSGEQLEDSSGNPENIMRYYVDINPAAKDLDSSSDVLTLTDTFSDVDKYSPELLMERVHLYAYDASAKNHKGDEIDPSRYTLVYDSSTATITAKIPDGLACVLQYDYRIDEATLSSSNTVTNSVKLNGTWSTSNSTQLKEIKSHASATHRSIKLYKVDADNYRTLLPDATFKLEKWDSSSKAWTTVNDSEETGSDGTLEWDLVGTASNPSEISVDTLYRLTETTAPDGYALDSTPHYFICRGDGVDNSSAWNQAGGSSATGAQSGTTVQQSETTFFNYSGGALYVPNKYTRLTVNKKWANTDGTSMDAPSGTSVKVQLYQSTQKADPDDTCAVTITYKGDESNQWYRPGGTITQNVKRGTSLKFTVSGWSIKYDVTINGTKTSYENSGVASRQISVPSSATQGSTLDIVVQETDSANAPGITLDEHTDPNTILTGETAYGDPVTLQNGAWSHSWDNLPTTDADGNQLRYTVKEEEISGYTVSYTNNDGVSTGNITVTNTKKKDEGYTLPNTGGPGMQWLLSLGTAVALAAATGLVIWRRRRA
ncbi:MAG: Cna B-type domain-containing protein [Eggerthellaceae bacterium]